MGVENVRPRVPDHLPELGGSSYVRQQVRAPVEAGSRDAGSPLLSGRVPKVRSADAQRFLASLDDRFELWQSKKRRLMSTVVR